MVMWALREVFQDLSFCGIGWDDLKSYVAMAPRQVSFEVLEISSR